MRDMSNTFDKLAVLDSFIEEVNSYLPDIETNLAHLAQSPDDMDALEETYRRTHTIGGSASMMDFPGLAHVAHGMEDILGDALEELIKIDEPALGLLRRSLDRLHRLLEGIRNGIDEESVIAEDDADYAHYRSLTKSSGSVVNVEEISTANSSSLEYASGARSDVTSSLSPVHVPEVPAAPSSPSSLSFEEVLASFRAPAFQPGEEVSWPEDPIPTGQIESIASQPASPDLDMSFMNPQDVVNNSQYPDGANAFDTFVAEMRRPSEEPSLPLFPPTQTSQLSLDVEAGPAQGTTIGESPTIGASPMATVAPTPSQPETLLPTPSVSLPTDQHDYAEPAANTANTYDLWEDVQPAPVVPVPPVAPPVAPASTFPPVPVPAAASVQMPVPSLPASLEEAQKNAQTIEKQASSLNSFVAQLREAISVIEVQRSEFKGFLDGSKDALDRMEEWAGRAMGLNLRNSPEQVRRYLPLSVMWVANSKLKRVLDGLQQIKGGAETTGEQIASTLEQLYASLQAQGEAFADIQARSGPTFEQQSGWSPWEMRATHDPRTLRESVTFERQGDLASIRAELEQQIREDLRKEFEAQKRLETQSTESSVSNLQEIEARLRSEIELQVRQELLNQILANDAALASTKSVPAVTPNTSVPIVSDRQEEVGGTALVLPPMPKPTANLVVPQASSLPTKPTQPSSVVAYNDFGEEAVEIFRMEAEEHLQTISMNVAALEKDTDNRDLVQSIRRATHTLKGAAGMMGFHAIADLSHVSEDLLDSIMDNKIAISSTVLSIILDTAEALDMLINAAGGDAAHNDMRIQSLHARYIEILGENVTPMTQQLLEEDLEDVDDPYSHQTAGGVTAREGTQAPVVREGRRDLSVRVGLQRLDELVNLFGELLVSRSVLEERIQRLVRLVADVSVSSNRLHDVGQKLDSRFEAATLPSGRSLQVMPGEGDHRHRLSSLRDTPAHLQEFDELELDRYTEFHQLARGLNEGISDMTTLSTEMDAIIHECEGVFARENRLSTTFQDRLMKTRLVPISNMAPRLYRAARAVALKQGKDVEFLLEGQTTEVDRTVFEEIGGPLLHLVRNAVNHAIEKPKVRIQKGKLPAGQVTLSASYEGNQIVITVRDDGTGLDRESIRQTAIIRGLIRPDQQLSENDVVSLIFHPGFSTAEVLSEESGRGVGLDVVRDSVSRLRGTLMVESTPNQGTAFTMTFPTSVAIQRAMMVRASSQQFAIPTVNVESIGRLDNFKRSLLSGQPAVLVRNELYPLQILARHMNLSSSDVIDDRAQIILVNAGGQRVALVVDEIKGQFDIVMKSLGPHLRQVHGIAGATILGNGRVVLILELADLLSSASRGHMNMPSQREGAIAVTPASVKQRVEVAAIALRQGGASPQRPMASPSSVPERGKHILVVDDSPSVRRVVSSMLKQHKWEVQMARDGLEALEMISAQAPAAVLLDIEMPRMDGYELISTVRAQDQYRTLPLIVLTSRAAAKHQQRAMSLGASAYVIKPYQDEELLGIIQRLVYGTSRQAS
jgi:chemotaxis protein histidine kinase CheA/ActR/RegA family two-component response regulator